MAWKFDLMGLIFMVVAIFVGNMLGGLASSFLGMGAGILGSFIVGVCVYLVFCLVTGTKMAIYGGVVFAISVFASGMITGYISTMFGFISGIIATIFQAVLLSLIFSFIAPQGQAGKLPVTAKGR